MLGNFSRLQSPVHSREEILGPWELKLGDSSSYRLKYKLSQPASPKKLLSRVISARRPDEKSRAVSIDDFQQRIREITRLGSVGTTRCHIIYKSGSIEETEQGVNPTPVQIQQLGAHLLCYITLQSHVIQSEILVAFLSRGIGYQCHLNVRSLVSLKTV